MELKIIGDLMNLGKEYTNQIDCQEDWKIAVTKSSSLFSKNVVSFFFVSAGRKQPFCANRNSPISAK